ncbi:cupin domain-containing protein [Brevundimonas sp. SL130]|uniref:cupin domain-containing protein n=1 Tax=Brevundimonas sp. SL130 TaxID=2995143 RepID=UPI00226CB5F3|nr:cupin domain-containing protein [Brevundimonas sp. SL130]WAC61340.1 cupin domain-containing protein [Brevundimonas sp. SL130]
MADLIEPFDALDHLVLLNAEGGALPLLRSVDAWRNVNRCAGGRVIGFSRPQAAEDLHPDRWEMHPAGDEFLHLIEGEMDVVLDRPGEGARLPLTLTLTLTQGGAVVVPQGIWHRLLLKRPSALMFVTPAGGTQMRPVEAGT